MAKDSFILYLEHQEIFEMLDDEQAGKLIKQIFEYEKTGNPPKLDKMLSLAFVPIMQSLDKNRKKYDEKCRKNKENISIRWNKNNTNVYERKNQDTNYTDNDNDNDNDNDSDNDSDNDNAVKEILENNNIFITPANYDDFLYICNNYDINWIEEATTRACNQNNRNFSYVMGILKSWKNKGFVNIDEIKKEFKKKETVEDRVRRALGGWYDRKRFSKSC